MVLDCHSPDPVPSTDPIARQVPGHQPAIKSSLIPTKLIIDTDPGIDDAMAIIMAFQSPELEVIGLTTTFGNATTPVATRNALHLCEVAGYPDMPVAEGRSEPLKGGAPRVSDFVHGSDGLGNTCPPKPKMCKIDKSAADFLVEKVREFPNQVTVLALGPLTNIAEGSPSMLRINVFKISPMPRGCNCALCIARPLRTLMLFWPQAMQKDRSFASNLKKLFVLGGSFFASGNVNPAAEANIYGDPEAADLVFTSGADIVVIGINLTTQIILSEADLLEIRDSKGRFGKYIYDMSIFYKNWHFQSDGLEGIFLHDPSCLASLLDPSLFTYRKGALRVETQGICIGHTLLDLGLKKWKGSNPWTNQPQVSVGWTVDTEGVVALVKERLKRPQ